MSACTCQSPEPSVLALQALQSSPGLQLTSADILRASNGLADSSGLLDYRPVTRHMLHAQLLRDAGAAKYQGGSGAGMGGVTGAVRPQTAAARTGHQRPGSARPMSAKPGSTAMSKPPLPPPAEAVSGAEMSEPWGILVQQSNHAATAGQESAAPAAARGPVADSCDGEAGPQERPSRPAEEAGHAAQPGVVPRDQQGQGSPLDKPRQEYQPPAEPQSSTGGADKRPHTAHAGLRQREQHKPPYWFAKGLGLQEEELWNRRLSATTGPLGRKEVRGRPWTAGLPNRSQVSVASDSPDCEVQAHDSSAVQLVLHALPDMGDRCRQRSTYRLDCPKQRRLP